MCNIFLDFGVYAVCWIPWYIFSRASTVYQSKTATPGGENKQKRQNTARYINITTLLILLSPVSYCTFNYEMPSLFHVCYIIEFPVMKQLYYQQALSQGTVEDVFLYTAVFIFRTQMKLRGGAVLQHSPTRARHETVDILQ